MSIDYKGVVRVLVEEVEFARNLHCKMENSEGDEKEYTIKDISFHILRRSAKICSIWNSYFEDEDNDISTSLMTRIWIGNERKIVMSYFGFDQVPMQPEGLKIFIRQNINAMIKASVMGFFKQKNKDNKYSVRSKEAAEIYLPEVPACNQQMISPQLIERVAVFSRELYRQSIVVDVKMNVELAQHVSIVVDSDGRQILEARHNVMFDYVIHCFNRQYYPIILSNACCVRDSDQLLMQWPIIEQSILGEIADHQKVSFIDSGVHPILFDHQATNILFHEGLYGHLWSGDYITNDQSTVFKDTLGRDLTQMSDNYQILKQLTMYVDPTLPGAFGGYQFDQEGIRGQKTLLCDRGVVSNFLYSRNSAARFKKHSNGHARAATYFVSDAANNTAVISPEARISHLVIESHSNLDDAALVKTIFRQPKNGRNKYDYYLYVSSNSGQVGIETGAFTMDIFNIKKIYRTGKRETIYGGGTISGTPIHLLSNIMAVGSVNQYQAGYCGASSGWVPVSSSTPKMFLMTNLVIDPKPQANFDYSHKISKYQPF